MKSNSEYPGYDADRFQFVSQKIFALLDQYKVDPPSGLALLGALYMNFIIQLYPQKIALETLESMKKSLSTLYDLQAKEKK